MRERYETRGAPRALLRPIDSRASGECLNPGTKLRITAVFPPYRIAPAGGYRVFFEYANRMTERGHRITLVFPGPSRRLWLLQHLGRIDLFPWFKLSPKVRVRYVLDGPRLHWTITPTDVLVFVAWSTEYYYPVLRERAHRTVQFAWDYEHWVTAEPEAKRNIEKGLTNESIPIVAGSSIVASMLEELGRNPVATIPPGVDTTVFRPRTNQSSRGCTIGMIARTKRQKGSAVGIAALESLRKRTNTFQAIILSPDELPYDLPSWIVKRTAVDDAAMAEFYNDCSIFLHPGQAEGFGLPALEAMACGAAVVSTDNGGISDFGRPGDNLLLSPVGDVEEITNNLALLIGDNELRRQIAASGIATAQAFSWDKSTDSFEHTLTALMA